MTGRREFIKLAATASAFLPATMKTAPAAGFVAGGVRLSVCIDMILTAIPFLERMERIKKIGYTAFEFWAWKNKDIEAIARKKAELGLEVATLMGSGWKAMNSEEARKAFVAEIRESLPVARKLGS